MLFLSIILLVIFPIACYLIPIAYAAHEKQTPGPDVIQRNLRIGSVFMHIDKAALCGVLVTAIGSIILKHHGAEEALARVCILSIILAVLSLFFYGLGMAFNLCQEQRLKNIKGRERTPEEDAFLTEPKYNIKVTENNLLLCLPYLILIIVLIIVM